jgi:hypothetical protein
VQDGIGSLFDVDDVLCDIVEIDPILVEVLRRYGRMVLSLARPLVGDAWLTYSLEVSHRPIQRPQLLVNLTVKLPQHDGEQIERACQNGIPGGLRQQLQPLNQHRRRSKTDQNELSPLISAQKICTSQPQEVVMLRLNCFADEMEPRAYSALASIQRSLECTYRIRQPGSPQNRMNGLRSGSSRTRT